MHKSTCEFVQERSITLKNKALKTRLIWSVFQFISFAKSTSLKILQVFRTRKKCRKYFSGSCSLLHFYCVCSQTSVVFMEIKSTVLPSLLPDDDDDDDDDD